MIEIKDTLEKTILKLDSDNLIQADLNNTNLHRANLEGTDLSGANLSGADLREADINRTNLPHYSIVPEKGSFVAFKKLREGIAEILIPEQSKRMSPLASRKCRAEFIKVLSLPDGILEGTSLRDKDFKYKLGKIVKSDSYDNDIRACYSHGINFFITRKEAEEF